MPITPNRSYAYPTDNDPATVPADLAIPLTQIDADVQTLVDEAVDTTSTVATLYGEVSALDGAVGSLSTNLTAMGAAIADAPAQIVGTIGAVIHPGDAPPPSPTEIVGTISVPVLWLDTRQPGAWIAAAPLIDNVTKSVVIPADEGATYLMNGAPTAAGTYPIDTSAGTVSVTVRAEARDGYTLLPPISWSGVITAGWSLLGVDALTSGTWKTGRTAPSGTWTVTTPGAGAITTSGLTVGAHGGDTTGTVTTGRTADAMRIQFQYDVSVPAIGGSRASIMARFGSVSPTYPGVLDGPGVTVSARVPVTGGVWTTAQLSGQRVGGEAWPTPLAQTEDIPATGTCTIEVLGTAVTVSVDGVQAATGIIAGPVLGHSYSLRTVGGIAVVRDFRVETA